ncbi:Hippurate hydrolase [Candidatus Rhodobacter oscarellae]|uniref:Hippurate hydrolase n=1 Tax=Candidatus Rhodobacter oscarellae TaxID=1675527 RepID=A0A0J9E464_9RHOB|nr:M20 aminoacylase family protein [Candidatus Rhodobacter lobularis]KMW57565.1 Hippurate hydrolase [Candidatus Rhodobacter lobularis]
MPVINRIGDFAAEMAEWRRWMHRNPELGFDCFKTAGFVAERLREFGVDEIHEGIATTGLVAIIQGRGAGEACIGLRADMDALPIEEVTGADYASETPGNMHACGHDGHTTMLLGAAKYLAETRNFSGRVALIFQPAEEGPGGGKVMVDEGIMERFAIDQVYGIHNAPLYGTNTFHTKPGPIMAAADEYAVVVRGVGGHAAWPHEAVDPIPPALAMMQAIQTITSRNLRPSDELVVSVNQIQTGTATNIIPAEVNFSGTIRTFSKPVQEMTFQRLREIVAGHAAAFGVEAEIEIEVGYPATVNHVRETAFAAGVAAEVVGEDNVSTEIAAEMGSEDFSYMLEARPGSYLFLGQGDTAYCHHPAYDFNDEISPIGASFFARLVEHAQPIE